MSSTLVKNIRICRCDDPEARTAIYAMIVNTAESNVHPITYRYWPIAVGREYEVAAVIAQMASDIFNGNLHWHGAWGSAERSIAFFKYAMNLLERAEELSGAVPELFEYRILYFKKDAPGMEILNRFTALERFKIREIWDESMLLIEKPTVSEIYWGQEIRRHYERSIRLATEPGILNMEKLQKNLAGGNTTLPEKYRFPFERRDPDTAPEGLFAFGDEGK